MSGSSGAIQLAKRTHSLRAHENRKAIYPLNQQQDVTKTKLFLAKITRWTHGHSKCMYPYFGAVFLVLGHVPVTAAQTNGFTAGFKEHLYV